MSAAAGKRFEPGGEVSPEPPGARVVLLTMPSLFGAFTINRLARQPGIQLVGVGLAHRVYRKRSRLSGVITLFRRTGWQYFRYCALLADLAWHWLLWTGRPAGLRKSQISRYSIADVNAPEVLRWLNGLQPDYIVSLYFSQWIGPEVRQIAKSACLNLHPAPLPALRGPDPAFRALERADRQSGVTLHDVADELDRGTIRYQELLPIAADSSVFGLYWELVKLGADRLARFLAGELEESPGAPSSGSAPGTADDYTTYPTPAEVTRFRRAGGVLITWAEWRAALSEID